MREYWETVRTPGKLYLNKKLFKENAELEFQDNYYSNFQNRGRIKVDYLSAEFENSFRKRKYKFEFKDSDNRLYQGKIIGYQHKGEIYSQNYYLSFRLEKYEQHCRFEKFKINNLLITYKIPFSYLLGRDIKSSFGFDDEYIIKFQNPIFSILVDKTKINFQDNAFFSPNKEPDILFGRNIVPTILHDFKNRRKFISNLNQYERVMEDVMLIISFLFYHKMDWFGYRADLRDKNNRMHEFLIHKDYTKNMGDDYLFEDRSGVFEKHFTQEAISDLIIKFRLKKITEKKKTKHFIEELISIKNKNSYKSRLVESLFLIEGICEYCINENSIVYPKGYGYSSYQEKIKAVIKFFKIPSKNIGFVYSNTKTKTKKKLWYVTDYRNQIAHSDIKKNFNWQKSGKEYVKVMNLIRRLIFILIEPNFQNIPYPEKVS